MLKLFRLLREKLTESKRLRLELTAEKISHEYTRAELNSVKAELAGYQQKVVPITRARKKVQPAPRRRLRGAGK